MFTINHEFIPGAKLPRKGRMLLTDTVTFKVQIFTQVVLLFDNSNRSKSSETSLDFMSDDLLQKSLERLVHDHYAPCTGWFEQDGTDLYIAWDNYEGDTYSPKAPVCFESDTIDTDYDEFYTMVQKNDPCFVHSKIPSHIPLPPKGTPLIYIKVTRLGPNSQALVISLGSSHVIFDGCAANQFYNNWAKLHRQMTSNPSMLTSLGPTDYTLSYPPLFGSVDLNKYRIDAKPNDNSTNNKGENNGVINTTISKPVNLIDICYKIPVSKQNEIRKEAHEEGVSFNTYLFGILWKELIVIYHHHNPEFINNISNFSVVVDVRSKIKTPLETCTDASIGFPVGMAVKDILETEPIDIAKTITSSLKYLTTPGNICKTIDNYTSFWKQACYSEGDTCENFNRLYFGSLTGVPNFMASSWLNIKPLGVDFGNGDPVCLRLPKNNLNGMIYVSPPDPKTQDSSILVTTTLPDNYDISKSSFLSEYFYKKIAYIE